MVAHAEITALIQGGEAAPWEHLYLGSGKMEGQGGAEARPRAELQVERPGQTRPCPQASVSCSAIVVTALAITQDLDLVTQVAGI